MVTSITLNSNSITTPSWEPKLTSELILKPFQNHKCTSITPIHNHVKLNSNPIPNGVQFKNTNGLMNMMVPSNGPLTVGLELKDLYLQLMNSSDLTSTKNHTVMPNISVIDLLLLSLPKNLESKNFTSPPITTVTLQWKTP
jgi:hypothetical protein